MPGPSMAVILPPERWTTIEVEDEEHPALYAEWIVRLVFDS